jgi:hypothetical protein
MYPSPIETFFNGIAVDGPVLFEVDAPLQAASTNVSRKKSQEIDSKKDGR